MSDKSDHPVLPEAFAALGVRPSILRALAELSYITPSEIQTMLIPRALAGVDILGQARTGTGKDGGVCASRFCRQAERGTAFQALVAGADARTGDAGGCGNQAAGACTRRSDPCRCMAGRRSRHR